VHLVGSYYTDGQAQTETVVIDSCRPFHTVTGLTFLETQ